MEKYGNLAQVVTLGRESSQFEEKWEEKKSEMTGKGEKTELYIYIYPIFFGKPLDYHKNLVYNIHIVEQNGAKINEMEEN